MKKILIFKTDRLGDLLNISPIISNLKLNNPSCEITLICSNYNEPLVKYYHHDLNYIVFKKSIIAFFLPPPLPIGISLIISILFISL